MKMFLWWKSFALGIHLLSQTVQDISAQNVSFLEEPMSQNVSEGTGLVQFNCTGYSLGYHWLINDQLPESNSNKKRGIIKEDRTIDETTNLKEHILKVPGNISNSGIVIKCFIYWSTTMSSNPATLLVQGLLDTVSNLYSVQLNSSALMFLYTPPFTLDGVPIRHYSVEISTPTNSSLGTTHTTPADSITIQIDNPCYEYFINVSAWNDVGQGKTASTSATLYQAPYPPPSSSYASVRFLSDSTIKAIIHTSVSNDCLGRIPDNITIVLHPSNEELPNVTVTASCSLQAPLSCDNEMFSLMSNSIHKEIVDVSINLSSIVARGFHYKSFVLLSNRIGSTKSHTIEFNTSRITFAEVINDAEKVCLRCIFADGNLKDGCLGVFVDRNKKESNQTILVPVKDRILCILNFPPGDYDVLVYDNERTENLAFELKLIIYRPSSNLLSTVLSNSTTVYQRNQPTYTSLTTTTVHDRVDDRISDTGTKTEMPILVIVLGVSSGSLVMLSLMVVSLMACLMKYKKKNNKLKIAELSALQRQRSAEMFLHNLTSSISQQRHLTPQVISNGYYETPTLPSVNPLYENLEETQQRLVGPINDVHMTECPAYVTMPTKL